MVTGPARDVASRRYRIAKVLLWLTGSSAALLLGASLYIQSAGFRGRVLAALERELAGSVRGQIHLSGLDALSLSSARLARLEVKDEHGELVLALEGIHLSYDPLELLGPLLPGGGSGVSIEHVRVERSRVLLVQDEHTGELTLVRAFGKDRPPGSPETPPAELQLALPTVELGEVSGEIDHPALGQLTARIHHVRGEAYIAGAETEVRVQHFGVQLARGEQRWADGTGSLRLLRQGVLGGTFHGFVRGTELDAAAQLDAGVLEARVDVPHALPERVRELWPGYPLQAPLAARLTAEGPLNALALNGYATSERSRITLTGDADTGAIPRARLDVRAQALDARLLSAQAPQTALDARAALELTSGQHGLLLVADVTTEPTTLDALALPSAHVALRSEGGTASARFQLADARGRLEGETRLADDGSVDLSARLTNLDLAMLPELEGQVRGRADLQLRARVNGARFAGSLDGSLRGLATRPLELAAAQLQGTFEGTFDALDQTALSLKLAADDVLAGPVALQQASLAARGTWHTSRFDLDVLRPGGGRGTARGRLALRSEACVSDVDVGFGDRGLALTARVAEYCPGRGTLFVERLSLTGRAGTLDASLRLAPSRLEVTAKAERLDTQLLLGAFGVPSHDVRALVSGEAELATSQGQARGQLNLQAEKLSIRSLSWQTLRVAAKLGAGQLDLDAEASDASLGRLAVRGSAQLAGPLHEPATWQRATGSGSLALERLPLWPVGLMLPAEGQLKELDGRLDINLAVERGDAAALPDLFFSARTDGLSFAVASAVQGQDDRRFEGYAVHGSASIDGHGGHGAATVLVTDEQGALVTSSGSLELDLATLLREPRTILERLFRTPLDALVRLHPRSLSQLPPPFGVSDLGGSVEATLQLRGSLAEPTLSLAARGHQLQGGLAGGERAVDVTSLLEYVPNSGRLRGTADVVQSGKSLVAARVEGRVPNPLDAPFSADAIELRAAAMLNGVPLELWPVLARERVQARVYGSVDVEIEKGQPSRQRAHLEIADLTARGHALGNGRLTFQRNEQGLRANLRIGSGERYLHGSLRGSAEAPGGDEPMRGSLSARDFDASSLSPLTSGLLSRLNGAMNAQLEFSLKRTSDDWYLGIDGEAKLENGSAHIEELGLEVREIAADVRARSTPEYTVIQIDPLRATARARTPNVRGNAELWLRGLRVQSGEANLSLNDVPLSLKGVSRGIARGRVLARLERQPDHLALEVKVPDLRVRLPPSSTRALIELDENADFRVLQVSEEPEELAPDALLWKVAFDLEDVRIQRGDFDVPLSGQPRLEYRHEIRPSGSIQALPGGRVRLFDQSFSIDRGLLQLVPEEPDNPRIDLTASWRAPDGTTVYVDVTGRAKDASVLTRDDRGLQDVERFYLITGGAVPEGPELAAGGGAEGAAIGQTFSLGINELLRDSLGNVAVSIGTTPDDRASYSASVRLTDKLSFQGSFQPASESNLEESTNDLTGTLDYRFSRRWSLRTELGTSGAAFDLLWSHRY
jgi:translocation and assembly module TamB